MPAKGLIRTGASNQPKEKCAPVKSAIPSQSASEESEQVSKTERVSFGYQPSSEGVNIPRHQNQPVKSAPHPPPPSDPAANEYSRGEQARKQARHSTPFNATFKPDRGYRWGKEKF